MFLQTDNDMENRLLDSTDKIKGIGAKKSQSLASAGITNVGELLRCFPLRYDFYRFYDDPAKIEENGKCVFYAEYNGGATKQYAKTVGFFVRWRIKTGTRDVLFTWFNQPYVLNSLEKGKRYCIKCDVQLKNGVYQAINPHFSSTDQYTHSVLEPQYKPIEGIGKGELVNFIKKALDYAEIDDSNDPIPYLLRQKYDIPPYGKALRSIHTPQTEEECIRANKRLIFEEFFMFRIRQKLWAGKRGEGDASAIFDKKCIDEFKSLLPYRLTGAQQKALDDVARDLLSKTPMNRIIQGDVGSGKTAVAFAACWMTKCAGYQSVIMVPTEVLARQHYASFGATFGNADIKAGLLVGGMKQSEKKSVIEDFAQGNIHVLIGTHAVLEERVSSDGIGLVITDEQHRFGVKQRLSLKNKGRPVNMLVLTATPIPRTLSMVIYGDLDVSIIDEMPPDRIPIKTYAVTGDMRERIYKFITKEVKAGRQAYVICPLVETDDESKASVKRYFDKLSKNELKEVRTGMLYGGMKPAQKDEVMNAFAAGDIDVLISTTVIEVGINVPNATVIAIEDAEKFGLAQLHQLRGRVGRGREQSHCILISDCKGEIAVERLTTLVKTNDGFEIAKSDMRLRGQGEYFGLRQHGAQLFRFGELPRDMLIFTQAADAVELVASCGDELGEFYRRMYHEAKRLNEEIVFN